MLATYCPKCDGIHDSKVLSTKKSDCGKKLIRRRRCLNCFCVNTTHEILEQQADTIDKFKTLIRELAHD